MTRSITKSGLSNMPPVLALDGPSGAGKGTIGQLCAYIFGGIIWTVARSIARCRGSALKNSVCLKMCAVLVTLADANAALFRNQAW